MRFVRSYAARRRRPVSKVTCSRKRCVRSACRWLGSRVVKDSSITVRTARLLVTRRGCVLRSALCASRRPLSPSPHRPPAARAPARASAAIAQRRRRSRSVRACEVGGTGGVEQRRRSGSDARASMGHDPTGGAGRATPAGGGSEAQTQAGMRLRLPRCRRVRAGLQRRRRPRRGRSRAGVESLDGSCDSGHPACRRPGARRRRRCGRMWGVVLQSGMKWVRFPPRGPGWRGSSHSSTPARTPFSQRIGRSQMDFQGTHEHTLDAKNRLTIPVRSSATVRGGRGLLRRRIEPLRRDLDAAAAGTTFVDESLEGRSRLSADTRAPRALLRQLAPRARRSTAPAACC